MRRVDKLTGNFVGLISIHAPYKRVRRDKFLHQIFDNDISIHAPYKRVRRLLAVPLKQVDHFNPRTLQESATLVVAVEAIGPIDISIHAPYKRVRPASLNAWATSLLFQSTHPTRECDLSAGEVALALINFNPRTLQESATNACGSNHVPSLVFQSTHPTRECDLIFALVGCR